MDEHLNQTYHTRTMEAARGIPINIPDRHPRYDIAPYATHYDAVAGRRIYVCMDTSGTVVLTVVLRM